MTSLQVELQGDLEKLKDGTNRKLMNFNDGKCVCGGGRIALCISTGRLVTSLVQHWNKLSGGAIVFHP